MENAEREEIRTRTTMIRRMATDLENIAKGAAACDTFDFNKKPILWYMERINENISYIAAILKENNKN